MCCSFSRGGATTTQGATSDSCCVLTLLACSLFFSLVTYSPPGPAVLYHACKEAAAAHVKATDIKVAKVNH